MTKHKTPARSNFPLFNFENSGTIQFSSSSSTSKRLCLRNFEKRAHPIIIYLIIDLIIYLIIDLIIYLIIDLIIYLIIYLILLYLKQFAENQCIVSGLRDNFSISHGKLLVCHSVPALPTIFDSIF